MKQLLAIALLAISSFSARADRFHNDSQCDLEYREVCIDVSGAPTGCTITGMGAWIPVPAMTHVTFPGTGCTPPDEIGYEVRYAASTGCTGSVIVKHPPGPPYSTTFCNAYPTDDFLPACGCNPSGNGLHVHINPDNIHINQL